MCARRFIPKSKFISRRAAIGIEDAGTLYCAEIAEVPRNDESAVAQFGDAWSILVAAASGVYRELLSYGSTISIEDTR